MSVRLKARRGHDGGGLDRMSRVMKKERVHQRILQQCDTMRNQSLTSHNAIILRGQYISKPDLLTKLSREHERKKVAQNSVENRIYFPSLASIRSIKLFSQSESNLTGITGEGSVDSQSWIPKQRTYRPVLIKDVKYRWKGDKRRTHNQHREVHSSSSPSVKHESEQV